MALNTSTSEAQVSKYPFWLGKIFGNDGGGSTVFTNTSAQDTFSEFEFNGTEDPTVLEIHNKGMGTVTLVYRAKSLGTKISAYMSWLRSRFF